MTKAENDVGAIKIANEVVGIIAGLAATEVEGVSGMSGDFTGGIAEMLGRKNLSKGVEVEVGETEAAVDLYLVMDYGVKIPDVAWEIQESVKQSIETMTGLNVVEVNVHVQGVDFEDDKEEKEDDESEGEDEETTEIPRVK